jgi:hypothetical protein
MATSSQENHKAHALHNEDVYRFLKEEKEFIDWRVTTAFYASLHFVEHKLFPLTTTFAGKENSFESIEEYRNFFGKRSKHQARIHAVKNNIKRCHTGYKELFDLSMQARYRKYHFSNFNRVDQKIERCLNNIKQACLN